MEIANDGLLGAWTIAPDGTATPLGWDQLDDPIPEGCWRWVHLHRDGPKSQQWLLEGDTPPDTFAWALMADDTRPRYSEIDDSGLLILRGVNLNEGAEPEDMISIRMFINTQWIVSVSLRRLMAVSALMEDVAEQRAPFSPGAFVEKLVEDLRERVEPVLDELEEVISEHELKALNEAHLPTAEMRNAFTDARQDTVMIRRHLAPQSETLRGLSQRPPRWVASGEALAEEAAAFERIVEDLDSLRERAAVLRDEMSARMAERMNEIMLVLSVVSVVFLPIAFVTGLLGMNVGGIPLTGSPWGFSIVCVALAAMAGFSGWIVRRLLRLRT